MTLLIIYLTIAIGVSFLCSILEAVLLSVTPSFVANMEKSKPRSGKMLVKVKDNLDQSISSILIINTFAHTMGAAGVGAQAIHVFGENMETVIALVLTLAILYFSEIIPKTLGATFWRKLAVPSAYVILVLVKLVYPLVWFSSLLTKFFSAGKSNVISREEVLALAALSHKDGALAGQENQLVENILKLKEAKTEDILTPRTVMHALDENISVTEALSHPQTATFTRIPVYLGHSDEITGVVLKAHLYQYEREGKGELPIREVAQKIYRVSENFPVLHLLDVFIKRHEHIFLVEDHFGQTAGVVTLEDCIETLIGREIVDESDEVEDMQVLARTNYRQRLKTKVANVKESK